MFWAVDVLHLMSSHSWRITSIKLYSMLLPLILTVASYVVLDENTSDALKTRDLLSLLVASILCMSLEVLECWYSESFSYYWFGMHRLMDTSDNYYNQVILKTLQHLCIKGFFALFFRCLRCILCAWRVLHSMGWRQEILIWSEDWNVNSLVGRLVIRIHAMWGKPLVYSLSWATKKPILCDERVMQGIHHNPLYLLDFRAVFNHLAPIPSCISLAIWKNIWKVRSHFIIL